MPGDMSNSNASSVENHLNVISLGFIFRKKKKSQQIKNEIENAAVWLQIEKSKGEQNVFFSRKNSRS